MMNAKEESMEDKSPDTEQDKGKAAILEQIEELKKYQTWKENERKINSNIEVRPTEDDLRKLDSNLKKNTAFVRKIKTYTESQKTAILKDISSLNLNKYIDEIATAITEAKLKMSDVQSLLEICSVLHQKYAEFAPSLMENWRKVLKQQNLSKLRVDVRFYCDLISIGILNTKEALPILGGLLTSLTGNIEDLSNIGIIQTFCRYCGEDFAGLVPRRFKEFTEEKSTNVLLPVEKQKNVQSLLKDFYANICKKYANDYKEMKSVEKTNYKILMTKGEVFTERKKKLEELTAAFKKLQSQVEQLSDLLDDEMPQLQEEEENLGQKISGENEDEVTETEETNPDALGHLWEDEDTKSFYEILVDLQEIVPAILYKDSKIASTEAPKEDTNEDLEGEEILPDDNEEVAPPVIEEDEDIESGANMSAKMIFDAFLANLPNCVNREMIDSAATEFCMQFNTKNNRKKLVKCLYSVHRNRQDLLPFYARLVATLNPCMPDIAVQLGQYLKQEFRWQLRKKDQMKIESKLKVCRFIGELVKFKMFAKTEALFCYKQLLFDFSHHHIEMACTLLDACGRFLYKTPESHQRTKIYLEQMLRKRTAMTLDQRYTMMIDNAYYAVNPPVSEARALGRQLTPIEAYVEKLIFNDLSSHNTEKVLKQIRKLHWDDPEESAMIVRTLGSVWNYKFNNIRYGASLIAGLVSYHDWVGTHIVEDVLENMRVGMELNDTKYNQKRLAVAKFLGELYNYRLIDSSVVFKVLYSVLTFGIDPKEETQILDQPEDMIRIRMICTILETCGAYFVSTSSKSKLKYFLAYFQQYYWKKRSHLFWTSENSMTFPFEVSNHVEETLKTLRPKIPPHKSQEDANKEVKKIEDEMFKVISGKAPDLVSHLKNHDNSNIHESGSGGGLGPISEEMEDLEEEDSEEDLEDDEVDEDLDIEEDLEDDLSQEEDSSKRLKDFSEGGGNSDEDIMEISDVQVKAPKLIKCEEDDDFVNMFDKMMTETLKETKGSTVSNSQQNIVAPLHLRPKSKSYADPTLPPDHQDDVPEEKTIQFAVLMRKGQKQTLKEVAVPKDSEMAVNLLKQEEAQKLEKERMKKLTLEINERQEEEDLNEAIAQMQRPGLVSINRERKPKMVPHKGVPSNVDAIFGNKRAPM